MFLKPEEVRQTVAQVKKAFPRFGRWKNVNKPDESHLGFTVWGEFVSAGGEDNSHRFFVTFNINESKWSGHLTIGQHSFLWSSADFGDAYLASSNSHEKLDAAIAVLKHRIAKLFTALSE